MTSGLSMKSAELRQAFLDFFAEQGHQGVASSSLVPGNDPTLLFTNAGMVQFKDVFLGTDVREYRRAASSQRCVRAGGKHNDLENVGYTARHHTFFEMLGNFSFGDYFKREAIQYAWRFLTEVLQLPQEKLWITVYEEDAEAEAIWLKDMGVSAERFSRCGAKDNFWSMGDTGPCGPCSEIFYDHGPSIAGGPPGSPDEDGDRYIEIWNLVFMQYDRAKDGSLTPLPRPSVDTGMGLERIAAVMQGVHNNYDIDLFQTLVNAVAALANCDDKQHASLRVIADHIRSCAFLIVDGVIPSNEGRGYVLRRIIRRAIRHGNKLKIQGEFFYSLVAPLVAEMGQAYPELAQKQAQVEQILQREEQQFARTLEQGLSLLEQALAELKGTEIPGEVVFKLYDTYGFPVDLTADIARERGLSLDQAGFEQAMQAQRQRARAASQFSQQGQLNVSAETRSDFLGYDDLVASGQVLALYRDEQPVDALQPGEKGVVVLDNTPFYAESGGQVGDRGELLLTSGGRFVVSDTQKQGDAILHMGQVEAGAWPQGAEVQALVDIPRRQAIALNHSATHLLHAALQQVLGEHVSQKGSQVEAERLRFDFAHMEPMTAAELAEVEQLVNAHIRANYAVQTQLMDVDAAKAAGAKALFGEKYSAEVRVLSMGEFSMELCGGTHAQRTGDIGYCKLVLETGIAAGVRRIEAVTGEVAQQALLQQQAQIQQVASALKAPPERALEKVQQLQQKLKEQEKQLQALQGKLAANAGSELASQAVQVGGIQVLAQHVEGVDAKALRGLLDKLRDQLAPAAIVLAAVNQGRVSLVAGVSKALTSQIKAGELVNHVAVQVGGKGGGRPDMAQAGGQSPEQLPQALASVVAWVEQRLVNAD